MYHIQTKVYTDYGLHVSTNVYSDPADAVIGLARELGVDIEYPVLKHIKKKERKDGKDTANKRTLVESSR